MSNQLLMKIGNTSTAWECGTAKGYFFTADWKKNFPILIKKFSKAEWWIASVVHSETRKIEVALKKIRFYWIKLEDIPGHFAYFKGL